MSIGCVIKDENKNKMFRNHAEKMNVVGSTGSITNLSIVNFHWSRRNDVCSTGFSVQLALNWI